MLVQGPETARLRRLQQQYVSSSSSVAVFNCPVADSAAGSSVDSRLAVIAGAAESDVAVMVLKGHYWLWRNTMRWLLMGL